MKTYRVALVGTLSVLSALAACGGFSSSPSSPPAIDASVEATIGVPPDSALPDQTAPTPDAQPVEIDCKNLVFSADFDKVGVAEVGWSSPFNYAALEDGGIGSGGSLALVEGGTTLPSAARFATFGQNRPDGAAMFLYKDLPWSGDCIGLRLDVMAPAPDAGGGPFLFAGITVLDTERGISLSLDTSGNAAGVVPYQRVAGANDANDVVKSFGSTSTERGQWRHVLMTLRRSSMPGMFDARIEFGDPKGSTVSEVFKTTLPLDVPPNATMRIRIGSLHVQPVYSEVFIDTVRVTSGTVAP